MEKIPSRVYFNSVMREIARNPLEDRENIEESTEKIRTTKGERGGKGKKKRNQAWETVLENKTNQQDVPPREYRADPREQTVVDVARYLAKRNRE